MKSNRIVGFGCYLFSFGFFLLGGVGSEVFCLRCKGSFGGGGSWVFVKGYVGMTG
jgi:hypothetical protein